MFKSSPGGRQLLLLVGGLFFFFVYLFGEFYQKRAKPRGQGWRLLSHSGRLLFQDAWVVAWALGMPVVILSFSAFLAALAARLNGPSFRQLMTVETAAIALLAALGFYVWGTAVSLAQMACTIERLKGGDPGFWDGWRAARSRSAACWRGSAGELWLALRVRRGDGPSDALAKLLVLPVMLSESLPWAESAEKARRVTAERFPADSPARDFMELAGLTFAVSMLLAFFGTLVFVFLPDFLPFLFNPEKPFLGLSREPFEVIAPLAVALFALAVAAALFVGLSLMAYMAAVYLYAEGGGEAQTAVRRYFPPELLPK